VATPATGVVAKYSVTGESEIGIQLSTHEASAAGRIPVVVGLLQIDLGDLVRTRGTVRADVASIEISAPDDTEAERRQSADARAWLDVGSSQPEADRERKRWAEFVIREIRDASAPSAYAGRRLHARGEPDAGGSEVREVTCTAVGDLTLHGYRLAQTVELRVRFEYPRAAAPDVLPSRVEVETRTPMVVSLLAHDIRPRDASGVVVATEAKLLGTKVAKEARITLRVVAGPAQ
jgi:hypothetical protein